MSPRGDQGHALVEALLLGLLLLVPVIWMLTVFAELHAAALGTTSAVREAGFEAARADDPMGAERSMANLVEGAMVDHGLDPALMTFTWDPPHAWRRGGTVEVAVRYDVPVFQAPFLGRISDPAVRVTASHVTSVDPYRSRDG